MLLHLHDCIANRRGKSNSHAPEHTNIPQMSRCSVLAAWLPIYTPTMIARDDVTEAEAAQANNGRNPVGWMTGHWLPSVTIRENTSTTSTSSQPRMCLQLVGSAVLAGAPGMLARVGVVMGADGVVVVECPSGCSAGGGRWAGVTVGGNGVVAVFVFMIVC
jgi:hypothetical protein